MKADRRRRLYDRRTAILLTAELDDALLEKAKKLNVAYAEAIRRAVAAYVKPKREVESVAAA